MHPTIFYSFYSIARQFYLSSGECSLSDCLLVQEYKQFALQTNFRSTQKTKLLERTF